MINNDLIDNSAENKLKRLIHDYKEHNTKRDKYYAKKMMKLGELESFIQELEDSNGIDNLPQMIKDLKSQNHSLKSQIKILQNELDRVRSLLSPELSHVYRNLNKTNKALIDKVVHLERSVSGYKTEVDKTKALANEYLQNLIKLQTNGNSTKKIS